MKIIQDILVFVTVALAIWILYSKFFKKTKNNKNCGGDDCGC